MKQKSAWIILVAEGKALLLKRSKSANNPGLWNFPGGNVDEGEEEIRSAVREMYEEAGIKIKRSELRTLKPIVVGERKMLYYFINMAKRPKVKINEESAKYDWFSLGKFPTDLHRPTRLLHRRLLKANKRTETAAVAQSEVVGGFSQTELDRMAKSLKSNVATVKKYIKQLGLQGMTTKAAVAAIRDARS